MDHFFDLMCSTLKIIVLVGVLLISVGIVNLCPSTPVWTEGSNCQVFRIFSSLCLSKMASVLP